MERLHLLVLLKLSLAQALEKRYESKPPSDSIRPHRRLPEQVVVVDLEHVRVGGAQAAPLATLSTFL